MAQIKHIKSARIRKDADGNLKPNHVCEIHPGEEIKPGDPYKHISVKTGPYSSTTRYRCEAAPDWHWWDYSSSLGALIAQIQYEGEQDVAGTDGETTDDWQAVAEQIAERIDELAEEKRESASNIRDGFGHDMPQSEELDEAADNLEGWATEIRDAANSLDDPPDEDDFDDDDDSGQTAEDLHQEALEAWQDEAREAITDALNNSPV
jgi:hypothetical protein